MDVGLIHLVITDFWAQQNQDASRSDVSVIVVLGAVATTVSIILGIIRLNKSLDDKIRNHIQGVSIAVKTKNGHTMGTRVDDIYEKVSVATDKSISNETKLAQHDVLLEHMNRLMEQMGKRIDELYDRQKVTPE